MIVKVSKKLLSVLNLSIYLNLFVISLIVSMQFQGLTEKFKEKDPRYTGSATLTYDTFMFMIIPFLVA